MKGRTPVKRFWFAAIFWFCLIVSISYVIPLFSQPGSKDSEELESGCTSIQAGRLATVRWGEAEKFIAEAIQEFEDKAFAELPHVEKIVLELHGKGDSEESIARTKQYLTKYTNDFARAAMSKYWELGDKFWGMFGRGF